MANKIYAKIKNYIKENYRFLISVILIITFFNIDTGYSIYKPGGVINMDKRITSEYKSEGSFNMAYVGYMKGKLPFYLIGKINPSWELVKNTSLKETNETIEDANTRDHLDYLSASKNAKIVAYKYSNTPYTINETHFYINYITEESKSDLKVGDELISYDDIKITSTDDFKNYISTKNENDKIKITYKREEKERTTELTLYKEENSLYAGLVIISEKDIISDTNIDIKTKDSESGPSGGLIMALSIYDALTKEDITYGMKIVGTGTIDEEGNVGKIGSVTYKLASAVKAKADIFLCPADNLEEALTYAKEKKYKITIKGVSTFEEALNTLKEEGEKYETNWTRCIK